MCVAKLHEKRKNKPAFKPTLLFGFYVDYLEIRALSKADYLVDFPRKWTGRLLPTSNQKKSLSLEIDFFGLCFDTK